MHMNSTATHTVREDSNAPPCDAPAVRRTKEQVFAEKHARRNAAIDALLAESIKQGGITERGYWAITHDLECASTASNLQLLAEIDFHPPAPEALSDEDLPQALEMLIQALAELGTYLLRTDHLTDRRLYEQLMHHALRDQVADIPPCVEVARYIDMCPNGPTGTTAVSDRDRRLPRHIAGIGNLAA